MSLAEGLPRITVLPASRLEKAVPRMKLKGRIQVGMDADITVFDPEEIPLRNTSPLGFVS
jgi:dihydroorotase-like cyclic amidohydrolase